MKKIEKSEPKFYKDFIRRNNPVNWEGLNSIRSRLREYILISEQHSQCAYCESSITPDNYNSHIDHFKRKHLFPELTFNYNNFFVSCKSSNHCAEVKDSMVNSKELYHDIINPVEDDPDDYFEYNLLGKLIPLNRKAEYTCEIFNLNHPSLKQRRNDVAWAVQGYRSHLSMEEVLDEIGEFERFIKFIWE